MSSTQISLSDLEVVQSLDIIEQITLEHISPWTKREMENGTKSLG